MHSLLMLLMAVASIGFGWLSTQRIGWLDGYSEKAALLIAIVFALGAALVGVPQKRALGATIGFVAGLIALVPAVFLTVVLFAFDPTLADGGAQLLLMVFAMTALVVIAFKVARAARALP